MREMKIESKGFCTGCELEALTVRSRDVAGADKAQHELYSVCEHMSVCEHLFERMTKADEAVLYADGEPVECEAPFDDDNMLDPDEWSFCDDAKREDMLR